MSVLSDVEVKYCPILKTFQLYKKKVGEGLDFGLCKLGQVLLLHSTTCSDTLLRRATE